MFEKWRDEHKFGKGEDLVHHPYFNYCKYCRDARKHSGNVYSLCKRHSIFISIWDSALNNEYSTYIHHLRRQIINEQRDIAVEIASKANKWDNESQITHFRFKGLKAMILLRLSASNIKWFSADDEDFEKFD